MKKYLVQVMFDFNDDIIVMANDPLQANAIAQAKMAEIYSVKNEEIDELLPFDSIIGYDAEEIA
jgi:hypothetical protein